MPTELAETGAITIPVMFWPAPEGCDQVVEFTPGLELVPVGHPTMAGVIDLIFADPNVHRNLPAWNMRNAASRLMSRSRRVFRLSTVFSLLS